jgi:hypothetical protein
LKQGGGRTMKGGTSNIEHRREEVFRLAWGWCLRRRMAHFRMLDPPRVFATGRNV